MFWHSRKGKKAAEFCTFSGLVIAVSCSNLNTYTRIHIIRMVCNHTWDAMAMMIITIKKPRKQVKAQCIALCWNWEGADLTFAIYFICKRKPNRRRHNVSGWPVSGYQPPHKMQRKKGNTQNMQQKSRTAHKFWCTAIACAVAETMFPFISL